MATPKTLSSLKDIDIDINSVAEAVASELFSTSETFKELPAPELVAEMKMVQAAVFAIMRGQNIMFAGSPGIGKTSFIEALAAPLTRVIRAETGIEDFELRCERFNLANITPENLLFPSKVATEDGMPALGFQVLDRLMASENKPNSFFYLLLDEPSRARSSAVRNALLKLVQDRSLDGQNPLPGLTASIATDNISLADGITSHPDSAFKGRFHNVRVEAKDSPWQYALAAKFSDMDLSTLLFDLYPSLDPSVREVLTPRTLEHMIHLARMGEPMRLALPIIESRVALASASGTDVTDEMIAKIASALEVPNQDQMSSVGTLLEKCVAARQNILIEGPPGFGKTSFVEATLKEAGYDTLLLSAAVVSPENLAMIFPDDGKLTTLLLDWFRKPVEPGCKGKVLIWDEIWRAPTAVRNSVMEPCQERSIGGIPIKDLAAVVGITNPKLVAGTFRQDGVTTPDPAQASRFTASITIGLESIPWQSYLISKYGLPAEVVVEWWNTDLDDEIARISCDARTCERLIELHRASLPLEWALETDDDFNPLPVPLVNLKLLFANREVPSFRRMLEQIDELEEILTAPGGHDHYKQSELQATLQSVQIATLEENRDACVRFINMMSKQGATTLLSGGGAHTKFWMDCFLEAKNLKK